MAAKHAFLFSAIKGHAEMYPICFTLQLFYYSSVSSYEAILVLQMSEEKKLSNDLGWPSAMTAQPRKRKEIEGNSFSCYLFNILVALFAPFQLKYQLLISKFTVVAHVSGVSAASLVALKSQLAKAKEASRSSDTKTKRYRGGSVTALLQRSNPGVADRDRVDRLSAQKKANRLEESHQSLERKAALYDRLSSGHMLSDEEIERYQVDFLLKDGGVGGSTNTRQNAVYTTAGGMLSADMRRKQERRSWEDSFHQELVAEEVAEQRHELIDELERQTKQGRETAAKARQERLSVGVGKKERLRAEFLKKKLEAAKAEAKMNKDGGGGVSG
jgi:hypothetical protein